MLTAVQHRWAVPAASRARIGRVGWCGHHDASLAENVVYELLIVPANNLRRSSGRVGVLHTAPEAAVETLPGSVMHMPGVYWVQSWPMYNYAPNWLESIQVS